MEIETRLLEEWKANNDLLKFYENLKQKRFAHFLTIQTAFLAFFGLLAKDDPFGKLVQSASAHASEHAILRMFWWLWIVLASLAALIHLVWHLVNGFGAIS